MRAVAVDAVICHISMFVAKWASLLGMALDTGLLDAVLDQVMVGSAPVGVVAVHAKDPVLLQGVMAGQGELRLGGLVAGEAKFARGAGSDLEIRAGMDVVAVEAGNLI